MLNLRDLTVLECPTENDYDGNIGLRISSVFVILIGSAIGVFFPVIASRSTFIKMPWYVLFVAKFFGSGVIISTAFIHLLAEAHDSLSTPCLGGVFVKYPWAFAICLMSLFAVFLSELLAHNSIDEKIAKLNEEIASGKFDQELGFIKKDDEELIQEEIEKSSSCQISNNEQQNAKDNESYYGKLLSIFILEFGILFHSVFVGLTLAVSGDQFITLYIVLIFHQMFEGFGLGARIATTNFGSHTWTPWIFCIAFSFITPVAIATGLGVRTSYPPGGRTNLITRGVFDSISAGVLIYTSLVELMAHDFLYGDEFKVKNGFKKKLLAFFVMSLGCGLMALIGNWA